MTLTKVVSPLNLPKVTILLGPSIHHQRTLAQAIGSLDHGIEFVDLHEPLLNAISELFFTGGLVDRVVDIDENTELPLRSRSHRFVKDWLGELATSIRDAYGMDGLAQLAIKTTQGRPILMDRILFLNVWLPEEARSLNDCFDRGDVLIIKCGTPNGLTFGATPIIQLESSDPVEQMAQLRREVGHE